MMVDDIVTHFMDKLEELKNPKLATDMENYMKNIQPFLGVPAPVRKKIYSEFKQKFGTYCRKELSNKEYIDVISLLWNGGYREHRYVALFFMEYCKNFIIIENLEFYKQIIIEGAWWDTTDSIASNVIGKIFLDQSEEMVEIMLNWSKDENMWIRRTSILCQLKSKQQTITKLLVEVIEILINENEFFIQKAIGWILREYSKSNRDWVEKFVKSHPDLSKLAVKEGSKYL